MNNNGYKQGYNQGHKDARNGKGKSYTRMSAPRALINGNSYMDQYVKGYDEGYRQGLKDARS